MITSTFKKHAKQVFGLCYYYLNQEADSEDVVMDVFEVFVKRSRKEKIDYPKAFLLETARRLSLQKLRKRFLTQDKDFFENFSENFMENGDAQHLNSEELIEQLYESIQQLKPQQQICIQSFYLSGFSYQEIAEENEMDLNTVKSAIQNGKRNLKILLQQRSKPK